MYKKNWKFPKYKWKYKCEFVIATLPKDLIYNVGVSVGGVLFSDDNDSSTGKRYSRKLPTGDWRIKKTVKTKVLLFKYV